MRLPLDLWTLVREEFLPAFAPGRFRIRHTGSRWENQYVDFEEGDLIARIQYERGWYEVLFASLASPMDWYGLDVVLEYLGLPQAKVNASSGELLAELRCLLEQHGESLHRVFDSRTWVATRASLRNVSAARWAALRAKGRRRS